MPDHVLRYRKSRDGSWAVFGPASMMAKGKTVKVRKKNGTTKEELIAHVSRTFPVNGVPYAYGFIARPERRKCDNCGEGWGVYERRDSSGLVGFVCAFCHNDSDYELSFG
jgi:hypothetical protein